MAIDDIKNFLPIDARIGQLRRACGRRLRGVPRADGRVGGRSRLRPGSRTAPGKSCWTTCGRAGSR